MSPDSKVLDPAVVAGMGSNLTQPNGISYFSVFFFFFFFFFCFFFFFPQVLESVMKRGRNSSLKFVQILNYYNISKLQYSGDPDLKNAYQTK